MRMQPSKRRVLATVLEATKLDFPHFSDCGHQTCFPLQLGFGPMKSDAATCIFAVPAPHVRLGTSASVGLPVCQRALSRVTYLLASWTQWLGPAILSGGWENILLSFSIKGKASTVEYNECIFCHYQCSHQVQLFIFVSLFLWKRQGKQKDLAPLKAVTQP